MNRKATEPGSKIMLIYLWKPWCICSGSKVDRNAVNAWEAGGGDSFGFDSRWRKVRFETAKTMMIVESKQILHPTDDSFSLDETDRKSVV